MMHRKYGRHNEEITHPETVCAENAEEAEQTVRDNVETPDFIRRMLRGDFAADPVDPHVFSVVEIKPTDAEIQAVRNWAANAVASMACEDTEFVYRTATREDIEDTFTHWILEQQNNHPVPDANISS